MCKSTRIVSDDALQIPRQQWIKFLVIILVKRVSDWVGGAKRVLCPMSRQRHAGRWKSHSGFFNIFIWMGAWYCPDWLIGYVTRQWRVCTPCRVSSSLLLSASLTNSRLQIWNLSWSESHLTLYLKFQWMNKAKEDYKPENNGPWLARSTLTTSTCVRSYNISKIARFFYVLALEKKEW